MVLVVCHLVSILPTTLSKLKYTSGSINCSSGNVGNAGCLVVIPCSPRDLSWVTCRHFGACSSIVTDVLTVL